MGTWNDVIRDQVRTLAAEGKTVREIGAAVGATPEYVRKWLRYHALEYGREEPRDKWPEDRAELVRKRWLLDGRSAGEIAKELGGGITRNAIIGLVFRRGWTRHPAAAVNNQVRANRAKAPTQAKRQPGTPNKRSYNAHPAEQKKGCTNQKHSDISNSAVFSSATKFPEINGPAFAGLGARTTLTVAANECRWPLEVVNGEQTLCGCRAIPERPYCLAHEARSRNPIQPKGEKDLYRALRRLA
jgi:GcrA cell cycle regulator